MEEEHKTPSEQEDHAASNENSQDSEISSKKSPTYENKNLEIDLITETDLQKIKGDAIGEKRALIYCDFSIKRIDFLTR
jgi:hypothetical protein